MHHQRRINDALAKRQIELVHHGGAVGPPARPGFNANLRRHEGKGGGFATGLGREIGLGMAHPNDHRIAPPGEQAVKPRRQQPLGGLTQRAVIEGSEVDPMHRAIID